MFTRLIHLDVLSSPSSLRNYHKLNLVQSHTEFMIIQCKFLYDVIIAQLSREKLTLI